MNNNPAKNGGPRSSCWTLARVREMNLQLEGRCQAQGCAWFGVFDIDKLIEQLGPDYELPENAPGTSCGLCGSGPIKFQLASLHQDVSGASP